MCVRVMINADLVLCVEQFLVPDHKVKQVSGATYSGFYYVCYHRDTNTITGYYYHKNSEW